MTMTKTSDVYNEAFKNIDHIDCYIALGQSVCAEAVEDLIGYIKVLESTLADARDTLAKVKELQSKYNELDCNSTRNKSKKTSIVRELFDIRRRGLCISVSFIIKKKRELFKLHEFFNSEWFIQLNGMDLDYKRVMRSVMKRKFNLDFSNILDYLEYYDNEINNIEIYIRDESVKGLNTSLLNN